MNEKTANLLRLSIVALVGMVVVLSLTIGCSHLPTQLTRAAATGCSVMLDQAAAQCGDPITSECAARVWNVPEGDARRLLEAAERVGQ